MNFQYFPKSYKNGFSFLKPVPDIMGIWGIMGVAQISRICGRKAKILGKIRTETEEGYMSDICISLDRYLTHVGYMSALCPPNSSR